MQYELNTLKINFITEKVIGEVELVRRAYWRWSYFNSAIENCADGQQCTIFAVLGFGKNLNFKVK